MKMHRGQRSSFFSASYLAFFQAPHRQGLTHGLLLAMCECVCVCACAQTAVCVIYCQASVEKETARKKGLEF